MDRDDIIRLKQLGWQWKDIAVAVKAKLDTVRRSYYRWISSASLPAKEELNRSKVKGTMGLKLKRIVAENSTLSYRNILARLAAELGQENSHISHMTCWRYFNRKGYQQVKLLRKPLVHPRNIQKRVNFAKENIKNPPEFWETVIWSEEATVRANPLKTDIYFKVHHSTKHENLPVNGQFHSDSFSMIWGCFLKVGLGPLVALEGSMTGDKYAELLKDVLLPELGPS